MLAVFSNEVRGEFYDRNVVCREEVVHHFCL